MVQELLRYATVKMTLEVYAQAVTPSTWETFAHRSIPVITNNKNLFIDRVLLGNCERRLLWQQIECVPATSSRRPSSNIV